MILKTNLINDLKKLSNDDVAIRIKKDNSIEIEICYYDDEGNFGITLHKSISSIYLGAYDGLGVVDLIKAI